MDKDWVGEEVAGDLNVLDFLERLLRDSVLREVQNLDSWKVTSIGEWVANTRPVSPSDRAARSV